MLTGSETRPLRPGRSAGAPGPGLSTVCGRVTVWVVRLIPARAVGLTGERELATLVRLQGPFRASPLVSLRGLRPRTFPRFRSGGDLLLVASEEVNSSWAGPPQSQRPGHRPPPPEHRACGPWPLWGQSRPCPHLAGGRPAGAAPEQATRFCQGDGHQRRGGVGDQGSPPSLLP